MIKFLRLSTLVFDPAKYEKLSKTEGANYELDNALAELSDSYEFGEVVLSEEDCWNIKRIESSYPQASKKDNIPLATIYMEKDTGVIISITNIIGLPSKLIETINTQLSIWHKELEDQATEIESEWNQETFKMFISEIMTLPKKERDKYLKNLNLKEVITQEYLEELKIKGFLPNSLPDSSLE